METATRCAHHWIIETPHGGATSAAYCRKCGAERAFRNAMEYPEFSVVSGSQYGSYRNRGRAS